MLFNSLEFVAFFLTVYTVYRLTRRFAGIAGGVLLVASLVFYASWNLAYLALIVGSATVDFFVGRALPGAAGPRTRRALLLTSLVYNLGVLAVFKYFDFFVDTAGWLATRAAEGEIDLAWLRLDVVLPVGISFFTFQSMSYTIDIYRGSLEPTRSYPRYLLFVSFFPQLVAGPIVRARDLLPQLAAPPGITDEMGGRGLYLIALGLFKKVVIADYLALNLVDRVFAMPDGYSALEVLVGIYGYAFQIYCDFSGYSDVAIGAALVLGFRFPDNFNAPYKSLNLQEFWRRWHISLSTWLRDYLYIPLGGNRHGEGKTYRNLLLTMLLGGLWHGAGWNFVIWGALHGGALALLRALDGGDGPLLPGPAGRAVAGALTFHYVCFAWIFFRATDLDGALGILGALGTLTVSTANLDGRVLAILGVAAVTHLWPRRGFDWLVATYARLPAPVQALGLVLAGFALREMAVSETVPFIYFQF